MSKKYWNTIKLSNGEISNEFLLKLLDHSYDEVVKGLSKKLQQELATL